MTDNFVKCTLPIKSMPNLIIPIVLNLLFKFCPPPLGDPRVGAKTC